MHGTTSDAASVLLAAILARSPALRLRDALKLSEVVHAAGIARLRTRYPGKSMAELAVMLGSEDSQLHSLQVESSRVRQVVRERTPAIDWCDSMVAITRRAAGARSEALGQHMADMGTYLARDVG